MPDTGGLYVENLSKFFGADNSVHAVDGLSLDAEPGQFVVLLGPSGCGKTTLLRCIAGLERPDSGRIRFGTEVVSDAAGRRFVPTHKRSIGMVFQSYSLWPHMTVHKNVEYPLNARKQGSPESRRRAVAEALELVECAELRDRLPAQLSGGQQQRVALARAIVANPEFILFDEPLSNLDFRLRVQLRAELRELHRRIGFTAVYVTHDQVEAFQLGTVVAVLNQGRVEQYGTPQSIYDTPASPYLAAFLGIENRIGGRFEAGRLVTAVGALDGGITKDLVEGAEYELFVRARDIGLHGGDGGRTVAAPPDRVVIGDGIVLDVLYSGDRVECVVVVGDTRLNVATDPGGVQLRPGDPVSLSFASSDAFVYPAP